MQAQLISDEMKFKSDDVDIIHRRGVGVDCDENHFVPLPQLPFTSRRVCTVSLATQSKGENLFQSK